MATIAGLRGTGDWGADERPKNFRETILFLEPNGMSPLQALLSKMGSESTDDPEFNWWEEKLTHIRLQVGTEAAAGVTTLVIKAGTTALDAVAGDLLMVESAGGMWANEIVMVTDNPTVATALKVTRGAAGTTAATITADSYITKIGNAFAEGTLSPKATTRNPTKLKNYCQIFKTTYEITETAKVTKSRTGPVMEKDKKRKLFDIMRDMEMASIYGGASETVGANGKPLRTTGGLLSHITTHRTQFGSGGTTLSEDNLIDFFSQVFNFDGQGAGNERLAFVGNTALTAINKLARDSSSTRINFDKEMTMVYGMNFTKWTLPQGTIYFKTHPLFNIHPELSKAMMVINPKGIKERPLRKLKFKDNVQAPDADYQKGQWIAETGFEFNHEETMAFAGGIA
ncbi:putative major capsid protein [Vibrio phage vB_VspS_VS-ABTNL-3]|nr:putative major capsid protein [Vibrio phage vB_VspS_VS-ABTNL-3]